MLPSWVRLAVLPLFVAAGVSACANGNAVQPGIQSASAGAPGPMVASQSANQSAGSQSAGQPGMSGGTSQASFDLGATGRVVSIRDIEMRGGAPTGGSGTGRGTLTGGLLGAGAGMAIGSATHRTVGAGLLGALMGAVGGAIVGTIVDRQGGSVGRGIEVVVEKDDGQTLTIAQRDDGDVQLGDRVVVVADRSGAAKAVRDTQRRVD